MRAVLQRVTRASVRVDGEVVGEISGPGILALVAANVAHRLFIVHDPQLRNFAHHRVDLVVSQFTLYGSTRKGRRPSWSAAAPGPVAEPLIDAVAQGLRERGLEVATGQFGAHMEVELVNDGPFTVLVEA